MVEENIENIEESKVEKWTSECLAQGFKYLGKSLENHRYSIAECNVCGHVDSYNSSNIRKGKVQCSNCKITQWSEECLTNGFRFIRKIDNRHSLSECLTCSHVDSYAQNNVRNGEVRCENCLVNKYKESVKPGWEYIDKIRIKRQTCVVLKHSCSDNLVTVTSGSFLKNSYDCPHCMHSHFDEPSNFYTIRITQNNQTIIKIGVANNTYRRFGQYGLPDDATIEILYVKPFETKRLAIKFESMVKDSLRDFKVDNEVAKVIFNDSGFTECFSVDSLGVIKQLI